MQERNIFKFFLECLWSEGCGYLCDDFLAAVVDVFFDLLGCALKKVGVYW